MNKLLVLFALLVSFSAFADERVSAVRVHNDFLFMVSDFNAPAGTHIYYNVDTVEDVTTDVLKALGVTNVKVSVMGFPGELVRNPTVYVKFDSARIPNDTTVGEAVDASWKTMTLKGHGNGILVESILEGVKAKIEIDKMTGSTSGMGSERSYKYEITTLVAQ